MVDQKQRLGFNRIDKLDFLMAYPLAHAEVFKSVTIQNSFAAAGLVPLNANRVISKLNIRLHTPPLQEAALPVDQASSAPKHLQMSKSY